MKDEWEVKLVDGNYSFICNGEEVHFLAQGRCVTEQDINEWIAHMSEYDWWNTTTENLFIEEWKKQTGFKPDPQKQAQNG